MIEQRTEEWFNSRLGKVTASRIADVMAKTKTGYGSSRRDYLSQLLCERMTGRKADSYTNAAMAWGTDQEPFARDAYSARTGELVVETAFHDHPRIAWSGASPDGLVGTDGLVEIKCPNTATHIDTLLGEPIQKKYIYQMQWQMVCTGREWCDFVSFDPRMSERHQLHIQRVTFDAKLVAEIESEVSAFLAELDAKVKQLQEAA